MPLEGAVLYLFIVVILPRGEICSSESFQRPWWKCGDEGDLRRCCRCYGSWLGLQCRVSCLCVSGCRLPQRSDCIMRADMDAFPGQRRVGCPQGPGNRWRRDCKYLLCPFKFVQAIEVFRLDVMKTKEYERWNAKCKCKCKNSEGFDASRFRC